jgi:hypothetical protein
VPRSSNSNGGSLTTTSSLINSVPGRSCPGTTHATVESVLNGVVARKRSRRFAYPGQRSDVLAAQPAEQDLRELVGVVDVTRDRLGADSDLDARRSRPPLAAHAASGCR